MRAVLLGNEDNSVNDVATLLLLFLFALGLTSVESACWLYVAIHGTWRSTAPRVMLRLAGSAHSFCADEGPFEAADEDGNTTSRSSARPLLLRRIQAAVISVEIGLPEGVVVEDAAPPAAAAVVASVFPEEGAPDEAPLLRPPPRAAARTPIEWLSGKATSITAPVSL